uniref:Citrate synthase n=1 Tax=Lotharella globosa TaxID=91324 RepID=A0A7S3YP81_9EUKA
MAAYNRLSKITSQLHPDSKGVKKVDAAGRSSLTITDNRTGKQLEVAVKNGVIKAKELWKLGLRSYDPGYKNTAACTSRITYIDGAKGLLAYRGIPIEQLAEKSTFLEVSYLLMYGYLPSAKQLDSWTTSIMRHTYIPEGLKTMMKSFRHDAHPMGMVISTVSAMSTFYPEANPAFAGQKVYADKKLRNQQIHRMLGAMTSIAAYAQRHRTGRPYANPSSTKMGYTENFLYMLDKLDNNNYKPHPKLARALDVLFILHADHEQNCSASGMRHLTSSGVDVFTSVSGAASALYGPRHGGANEAVLRMLAKIGDKKNIPQFIANVKAKKERLMGFGHRVYKNYDPRARIVRKIADEVFQILGYEPLIEIAMELEKIALSDKFFVDRKLYPNVDFYSGLIYKAMGFPPDFFTVLFTIPRTAGWLAHWNEFLDDPENVIVRPRQVYLGPSGVNYADVHSRQGHLDQ